MEDTHNIDGVLRSGAPRIPNEESLDLSPADIELLRLECLDGPTWRPVTVSALFGMQLVCDWGNLRNRLQIVVEELEKLRAAARNDGIDHDPDNPQDIWCCDTHRDEFNVWRATQHSG